MDILLKSFVTQNALSSLTSGVRNFIINTDTSWMKERCTQLNRIYTDLTETCH